MKTTELYPLQFVPQYDYRLWGGNNFTTLFKRSVPGEQLGESWEISGLKNKPSMVSNGRLAGQSLVELIEQFPEALLGEDVLARFGAQFPLLIKFIDAKKPLSVQVHPNDELAQERHQCFGKNEMWYVVDAAPKAEITLGFKQPLSKAEFQKKQTQGTIEEALLCQKVQKGDAIHVPAGLLHAIGGGILLAEIQQASDITYRVHDYDRIDTKTGQKRTLHNELALDAIDFSLPQQNLLSFDQTPNVSNPLIACSYFTTDLIVLEKQYSLDLRSRNAFTVLICVEGTATLNVKEVSLEVTLGGVVLIPAELDTVSITGTGRLLSVTI